MARARVVVRGVHAVTFVLALAALAILPASPAAAEDGAALSVVGGFFDVGQQRFDTFEGGLELRLSASDLGFLPAALAVKPMVGVSVNEDEGAWIYGGFRLDYPRGRWLLSPSFAVALYDEGDGVDLGGALEFRTSGEVAYRMGERSFLGVAFYHLSNAGIYDLNPGSNSLVATYTVLLGGR